MNGLEPFERTIEQTTETMPPSPKTITAAAMTTNRITSLGELLHYRKVKAASRMGIKISSRCCVKI